MRSAYRTRIEVLVHLNDKEPTNGVNTFRMYRHQGRNIFRNVTARPPSDLAELGLSSTRQADTATISTRRCAIQLTARGSKVSPARQKFSLS